MRLKVVLDEIKRAEERRAEIKERVNTIELARGDGDLKLHIW